MEETPKTDLMFDGITCPVCGGTLFDEYPGPKTIFQCAKKEPSRCSGVVCKCLGCDKMYPATNFGKHGDVYECKTCGRVQWDYTELRRDLDWISSVHSKMSRFSF